MKSLKELLAILSPYSSVVGQSIQLLDKEGKPFCLIMFAGTTPDKKYEDWAPLLAAELAALINANTEVCNYENKSD